MSELKGLTIQQLKGRLNMLPKGTVVYQQVSVMLKIKQAQAKEPTFNPEPTKKCIHPKSTIIGTLQDGRAISSRRKCDNCGIRWATFEIAEEKLKLLQEGKLNKHR